MSTDGKPTHLIERAAARMTVPWGEVLGRRAPTAEAGGAALLERGLTAREDAASSPPRPAMTPVAADVLAAAGMIERSPRYMRIAEEFRIVQSKVLREAFGGNGVAAKPRGNLVLVTSALPGEGKSFVSLNLAAGIGRQGDRRVLLIDTDNKPNSLSVLLGTAEAPGLLDLLRSGDRHLDELIIPTAIDRLDLLPLGSVASDAAEAFAGKRMAAFLDDLSRRHADRLIIIDSPPCLSSSNPHVLAATVGQIILVIAAGSTHLSDVEAALELVQNCPTVSTLLNKIAAWSQHSFGAYTQYPSPST